MSILRTKIQVNGKIEGRAVTIKTEGRDKNGDSETDVTFYKIKERSLKVAMAVERSAQRLLVRALATGLVILSAAVLFGARALGYGWAATNQNESLVSFIWCVALLGLLVALLVVAWRQWRRFSVTRKMVVDLKGQLDELNAKKSGQAFDH